MFLDEPWSESGGDGYGRACKACKQPIRAGEPTKHIEFNSPDTGAREMSGDYHLACSKPFESMAHIINMKPFG